MGFRDLSTSRALLRAYDTPQSRWTRFPYRQQRQQQRQQQQLSILDTSKQIIKKSYCIHERVVFLVVRWLRSYGTPWSPQGESDQACRLLRGFDVHSKRMWAEFVANKRRTKSRIAKVKNGNISLPDYTDISIFLYFPLSIEKLIDPL
uniref:Uncharacterized protein n=1 Tax=Vespula pensylvanica TaxID=30213 RepID=A0A834P6J7_VESPE|nr:hypothetical protein H0235_006456 [Vespula pensylvanica]